MKNDQESVCCRGRWYRVQGRVTVRRRDYLLLQMLSRRGRSSVMDGDIEPGCDERWLVTDARRRTLDHLRSLQILPERMSYQGLRVLQRLTDANPFAAGIIDYECRRHGTLLVSQWIPGEPLSEWLERKSESRRRISLPEALRLYGGLVRSVSGFHRTTGLVHGDIHPSNFIIGSRTKWLIPIDYGSAWRSLEAVTERQTQGFRALWAAPEVNLGEPGDLRSDQFSATLILFVLLAGELPFDRLGGRVGCFADTAAEPFWETPIDVIGRRHPLTKPAKRAFADFLKHGLAMDPGQRFATNAAWLSATDQLVHQITTIRCEGSFLDRLLHVLGRTKLPGNKNGPVE
ncbi:MAG: hypothetical protein KDA96_12380 [Planctomycetaceae bacterium]|nr:hypothetical protein [Planctomycetaceae bacterium]